MENRKTDHIELAGRSNTNIETQDTRFNYEPLFSSYPNDLTFPSTIAGKTLQFPIWISSMTGGTNRAAVINQNLAKACAEFGLGMGLGSCRSLLESAENLNDFNVREHIGENQPLFANLGISQLEQLVQKKEVYKVNKLVETLKADGIIIHINPLQEAIQPEGDRLKHSAIETLTQFMTETSIPVMVKEVGQGMGPQSIKALLQLPLEAFEFGAFGGTNFSKLETLRNTSSSIEETLGAFIPIGHTAEEMVNIINKIDSPINCNKIIISGGVKNAIDGYYLTQKCKHPSLFGMGYPFLKHAAGDYSELKAYIKNLIYSYQLAASFLKVR